MNIIEPELPRAPMQEVLRGDASLAIQWSVDVDLLDEDGAEITITDVTATATVTGPSGFTNFAATVTKPDTTTLRIALSDANVKALSHGTSHAIALVTDGQARLIIPLNVIDLGSL